MPGLVWHERKELHKKYGNQSVYFGHPKLILVGPAVFSELQEE